MTGTRIHRRRRRRKPINRRRQLRIHIILFFAGLALMVFLGIFLYGRYRDWRYGSVTETPESQTVTDEEEEEEAESPEEVRPSWSGTLTEKDIYTFLQGPKAWESKADFSGEWYDEFLAGQRFSVFGCGLCDLANIYSTLTPYECSPLDMYEYAQEASDYTPVSGYGAIDWPYLRDTLASTGIISEIRQKDETYEEFQENVSGAISVIALVCSYDDSTYWEDVEGHYVNLWLYDGSDDTVLLGDSGNPAHNRQRIPLRYVYDALKSAADYQYLLVTDVDEEGNTWKHDGIDEKWNRPSYL